MRGCRSTEHFDPDLLYVNKRGRGLGASFHTKAVPGCKKGAGSTDRPRIGPLCLKGLVWKTLHNIYSSQNDEINPYTLTTNL